MGKPMLFSPAQCAFIAEDAADFSLSPAVIAERLNAHFGTSYTALQVLSRISAQQLRPRRRAIRFTAMPRIFTDDQAAFIAAACIERQLPPKTITQLLNAHFGTSFTITQINSRISGCGLRERRRAARVALETPPTPTELGRNDEARKQCLASFAQKSVAAIDRTFEILEQAATPRDLAHAATAASNLVKTYQVCMGGAEPAIGGASEPVRGTSAPKWTRPEPGGGEGRT